MDLPLIGVLITGAYFNISQKEVDLAMLAGWYLINDVIFFVSGQAELQGIDIVEMLTCEVEGQFNHRY